MGSVSYLSGTSNVYWCYTDFCYSETMSSLSSSFNTFSSVYSSFYSSITISTYFYFSFSCSFSSLVFSTMLGFAVSSENRSVDPVGTFTSIGFRFLVSPSASYANYYVSYCSCFGVSVSLSGISSILSTFWGVYCSCSMTPWSSWILY